MASLGRRPARGISCSRSSREGAPPAGSSAGSNAAAPVEKRGGDRSFRHESGSAITGVRSVKPPLPSEAKALAGRAARETCADRPEQAWPQRPSRRPLVRCDAGPAGLATTKVRARRREREEAHEHHRSSRPVGPVAAQGNANPVGDHRRQVRSSRSRRPHRRPGLASLLTRPLARPSSRPGSRAQAWTGSSTSERVTNPHVAGQRVRAGDVEASELVAHEVGGELLGAPGSLLVLPHRQ
jgi:hypothetical protein